MILSLVSHQLLLILKAGFTRDRQWWKCDEITSAVSASKHRISGSTRGTVDTQRAFPAAGLPEELQEQTCPMAPLLAACCRAL